MIATSVNLERVSTVYGVRVLLDSVSLSVGEGQRTGVVGRNGDGKTTLLRLLAGGQESDSRRVSSARASARDTRPGAVTQVLGVAEFARLAEALAQETAQQSAQETAP